MKFILTFLCPLVVFSAELKERIAVVVNPVSGGKKKEAVVKRIQKELGGRYEVEILYTKAPGHATQLARDALKRKVRTVVAVGGDGLVNEVSQALIGTKTPLAIVPTGSGNGLARHLQIPLDPVDAAELIHSGRVCPMDTVRINDRHYVGIAGVGFDADISWLFSKSIRRGFASYLMLTLQHYPHYQSRTYELEIDGRKLTREAFLIAFANSTQFGNGVQIAPEACHDDGLLDVVILHPFPHLEGMRIAYRLFHGTLDLDEHSELIRCKQVTLRQPHLKAHIDGEPVLFEEGIRLEIVPASLNVIVPLAEHCR